MTARARWRALVAFVWLVHLITLCHNYFAVPFTHGYDWPGHLAYLHYVDENWTVPPPEATAQFFNPPLYYFSVAGLQRFLPIQLGDAGQLFNVMCAAAVAAMLTALCRRLWGERLLPTAWLLGFYVLNPTVYRAFGMVRPEPMLITIFTAAALLVSAANDTPTRERALAVCSGLLAGVAVGVRQWGLFLEGGFLVWLAVRHLQRLRRGGRRWKCISALALQIGSFLLALAILVVIQGRSPLAFNAPPQSAEPGFLTRLELPVLFTSPVRPALDYRFWPVLYADFWGDYWRYWREALIHDPMPSSASTVASLVRSMWAGIPATTLALVGLVGRRRWFIPDEAEAQCRVHEFARILTVLAFGGFAAFALRYAVPGKGDTVKSVYLVYLVPFLGYLAGVAADGLSRRIRKGAFLLLMPLVLMIAFIGPNCLFEPAEEMANRTWQMPQVGQAVDIAFGEHLSLAGYSLSADSGAGILTVTLVWSTDGYIDLGYKVFVHAVDEQGVLLVQSDSVPAGWTRPTQAWLPGEFIVDVHELALGADLLPRIERLLVGMYGEADGVRLTTEAGTDQFVIEVPE